MTLATIPHIVPILSGKGGVGKSSTTVQLALSLCLRGHSVGVLDTDLTGPSIPRFFGIEAEKVRQAPGGWLPVIVHQETVVKLAQNPADIETSNGDTAGGTNGEPVQERRVGSLYCMSLGFLLRSRGDAVIWRGPKKTAMIGQLLSEVLWPEEIEYLLIDTPPGTSDEHISLVTNLMDPNKLPPPPPSAPQRTVAAVIVTTPQAISTADVRKELTFCRKVGLRVKGVVENMAGFVCPCCGEVTNVFSKGGGEVMAKEFGVKFLGSVPLDGEGWGALIEEGKRPTYTSPASNGDAVQEERPSAAQPEATTKESLVDRYTSCRLFPVFDAIAAQVVGNEGTFVVQSNGT